MKWVPKEYALLIFLIIFAWIVSTTSHCPHPRPCKGAGQAVDLAYGAPLVKKDETFSNLVHGQWFVCH